MEEVISQVRIPRILLGTLVGGGLAVSGAPYQTLFKNPMVSPDILGVSAGAGFGAALAMLGSSSWVQIQLGALVFSLAAVVATYLIGSAYGETEATILVLAGVTVPNLFQALLSVAETYADTDSQLSSVTFWLMDSLGEGDMEGVGILLSVIGVCLLILFLYRNQIDTLATGEEEVATLEVDAELVSFPVIVTPTMMTMVPVSIYGMIRWAGLVVPHTIRLFTGVRYSRLTAMSFLIGGFFLLLMGDTIRGANSVELLLGILTTLVGTLVFVFLPVRSGRRASRC